MTRVFTAFTSALALGIVLAGPVAADPGAEMYLDRAEEILHHSCASLVEESGEDATQIESVVRLMVAVSLYNRGVDVSEIVKTDEEKEALKGDFIKAVSKACEEDSDSLLAGVVDRAIVQILASE